MIATELVKMLKGWPKEVRPEWMWPSAILVPFATDDELTDLACMAGLRHLSKLPPPSAGLRAAPRVTWYEFEPETVLTVKWCPRTDTTGVAPEGIEVVGPTLLHAIDAAIRATSGGEK